MITKSAPAFYSGTSGIALELPKRLFPPAFQDKSRLHYYASLYNSLEINSSFYKLPMISTVNKWSEDVPANFQFTFKLWKGITHNKGLEFNAADVQQFFTIIDHIGDKKGCLLVQFPASVTIAHAKQFYKLARCIRKADPDQHWKTVVEFRNVSWYQQEVYDQLLQYNMGLVLHDLPSSATPIISSATAFVYLRFHGPGGGYRGSYSSEFLEAQSTLIDAWLRDGKEVYAYFNNTMGDAAKNVMMLNEFVRERFKV